MRLFSIPVTQPSKWGMRNENKNRFQLHMVYNYPADYDPVQKLRQNSVVVAVGFHSHVHCSVLADYCRDMVLAREINGSKNL